MPRDVCFKCREAKNVRLCGDDLLCKDCDADNERQLAAIRAPNLNGRTRSAQVTAAAAPPPARAPPVNRTEPGISGSIASVDDQEAPATASKKKIRTPAQLIKLVR
jgi:hypothetical protein